MRLYWLLYRPHMQTDRQTDRGSPGRASRRCSWLQVSASLLLRLLLPHSTLRQTDNRDRLRSRRTKLLPLPFCRGGIRPSRDTPARTTEQETAFSWRTPLPHGFRRIFRTTAAALYHTHVPPAMVSRLRFVGVVQAATCRHQSAVNCCSDRRRNVGAGPHVYLWLQVKCPLLHCQLYLVALFRKTLGFKFYTALGDCCYA